MAFPGSRRLRQLYLSMLFFVTGRAVQAASGIDPDIREEVSRLPDECTLKLTVWPKGPGFSLRKTEAGTLRLLGRQEDSETHMHLEIQAPALGFTLAAFRESTALAASKGRISASGDLALACSLVRILSRTEIYLLPRSVAMRAVKRYESPPKKHRRRLHVLFRTVLFKPPGGSP